MPLDAAQVLDKEYLELRAKILEIGASLDRLDRSPGKVGGDPRLALIRDGLRELLAGEDGRAERIQLLFSLPYDGDWKRNLSYPNRR
jgi:hypothetical protein